MSQNNLCWIVHLPPCFNSTYTVWTVFLRVVRGIIAGTLGLFFFFFQFPFLSLQGPFLGPSLIIACSIKLCCVTVNQKREISGLVWKFTQFVKQQTILNSAVPNPYFAPSAVLNYDFHRIKGPSGWYSSSVTTWCMDWDSSRCGWQLKCYF